MSVKYLCSFLPENYSSLETEDDWQYTYTHCICKIIENYSFSETEDDFFLLVWILNDRGWPHSSTCPCCSLGINHKNDRSTLSLKKFGLGNLWVEKVWTQNTCILAMHFRKIHFQKSTLSENTLSESTLLEKIPSENAL